jgi:hypothetical protein
VLNSLPILALVGIFVASAAIVSCLIIIRICCHVQTILAFRRH